MDKKELDNPKKSNTIVYTIRWNPRKSARLKRIRGVSFEELIVSAKLLDIIQHPKRQEQRILVCKYRGYVWLVPCVIDGEGIFLKTLYPSRKYRKLYKEGAVNEKS